VLVHGYEQWGTELLGRLNGQFAFCIFDRKQQRLFLARDRMGIKPLYLYAEGGKFLFGSEMKVLLEGGIPKAIDTEAMAHYWLYGYTTGRRSILQHVRQLLPGHLLVYEPQGRQSSGKKPIGSFDLRSGLCGIPGSSGKNWWNASNAV
jgi:asparagine synthase (glutamine-hydrolysing)